MNFGWYKLENREVKEATLMEAGPILENIESRRVEHTSIKNEANYPGGDMISTVFLGLSHGEVDGKPVLFETMIFGGEYDQHMWRYCDFKEAEEGHWKIVDCIRAGIEPDPDCPMDHPKLVQYVQELQKKMVP